MQLRPLSTTLHDTLFPATTLFRSRYRDMLASLPHAATIVPRAPRLYHLQAGLAARAGQYALARSLLQRTRGELDAQPSFMLLSAIVELELGGEARSEEHTSELQSLMRISYAVFCLKKKKKK